MNHTNLAKLLIYLGDPPDRLKPDEIKEYIGLVEQLLQELRHLRLERDPYRYIHRTAAATGKEVQRATRAIDRARLGDPCEQLLALGYLKSHGPEEVRLTATGTRKADEIDRSIQIMDRILLLFYHGQIFTGGEHE